MYLNTWILEYKILQKKFTLNPQNWTIEKREIIFVSWFLNDLSSFSIKLRGKNKTKIWNSALLKNFSKLYGSGSASKLNGS